MRRLRNGMVLRTTHEMAADSLYALTRCQHASDGEWDNALIRMAMAQIARNVEGAPNIWSQTASAAAIRDLLSRVNERLAKYS